MGQLNKSNSHESKSTGDRLRQPREDDGETATERRQPLSSVTRRGAVKIAGLGLVGAGTAGTATADDRLLEGDTEGLSAADEDPVKWAFEVDNDFVESSPTVVDDVVYFGDGALGENVGTVYAISLDTEELLWSADEPAQLRSDPQVVDGELYIADTDGVVHAYDAESGDHRWDFQTDETIWSSPTRAQDTVYIGSDDGYLYALDVEDGSQRWRYEVGYPINTSPTIVDDIVYFADNPGETNVEGWVHAVDAETGDGMWTFEEADLWINSSPTVADGAVFVGSDDGTLYALDAADGTLEWAFTEPDAHVIGSPTYHEGVVYVGTDDTAFGASDEPTPAVLYAVDADEGEKQWEFSVEIPDDPDDEIWRFHSSPTVVDETVFIGNMNGTVYGLPTERPLAKYANDGDVVERDGLQNALADWRVDALDVNTLRELIEYWRSGEAVYEPWSYETGEAVWGSPTVVDGTLYVGNDDGKLYALDAGVTGSSEGSRVLLGTLGHTDAWAEDAIGEDAP